MWPKFSRLKLLTVLAVAVVLASAVACSEDDVSDTGSPTGQPATAPSAGASPTVAAIASSPTAPSARVGSAPSASAASTPSNVTATATMTAPAPSAPVAREAPSGTLTIAVSDVNTPNGLPRFCMTGCAETIYMSGITDTLFNSKATPDGTITTEPMLALSFELDPGLEFAEFTLKKGVVFHGGYGEMTAEDVAFSFNDANSYTNPESIHGQAGDFAPLISSIEVIDTYKVRLNYRSFDSRGILHRFSRFWQTAGILLSKVFEEHGVEGMQDLYVGVGAFENDEWIRGKNIVGHAFVDYWGRAEGWGPFVEKVVWQEMPKRSSRRAALRWKQV